MLGLLTQIGNVRFAVDARAVVEVVPRVQLHPAPPGAAGLAGLLRYRGKILPVIDLGQALAGAPTPARLSARILVARCKVPPTEAVVGFIVEQVTEARRLAHIAPAGGGTDVVGHLLSADGGVIHLLDLDDLARATLAPLRPMRPEEAA
jgi:chemotaxis signal transduction protein